jgi:hypothetical protein
MELVGVEQFAGEFTALGSKGWYHGIPLADRTKDTSTNYFSELSLTFGRVCYTLLRAIMSLSYRLLWGLFFMGCLLSRRT